MDIVSIIAGFSGPLLYIIVFMLALVLSMSLFLPVPVFALVVTAAKISGDPLGIGIVAGVGSAIGELSGYFIGAGGEHLLSEKGKTGKLYARLKSFFQKYGFFGIIAASFFPLTPIDFVGLIAGTLRYGWTKFLIATVIGKIPRYVMVAYSGEFILNFLF